VLAGEQEDEREGAFEPRRAVFATACAGVAPSARWRVAMIATASVSVSVLKGVAEPGQLVRSAW
jgi:hypothetical protein